MQSLHPVKVSKLGSFPDELTAQPSPNELYLILTNSNSNLISILGARGLRVPAASGPTDFIPPRVTPARSPCQVITEPAAACPVGARRSEITPPETKAAGRGEKDVDLHLPPHNHVACVLPIQQKFPGENPRDTPPCDMSCLCVTLTHGGYGNLFIVMRMEAARLWTQFEFTQR